MIYQVVSPFTTDIYGESYKDAIKHFVKLNRNLNISQIRNKAGIITAINNERASVDFNGQIIELPVFELIKLLKNHAT